DSNRDALRHCPLKTACLPVSPPGRSGKRRRDKDRGQAKVRMSNIEHRISKFYIQYWTCCGFQFGECTPCPSYGRLEPMPGPDGLMASRLLSICAMTWRIEPGNGDWLA